MIIARLGDVSYRKRHSKGRNKTQDTAHVESNAKTRQRLHWCLHFMGERRVIPYKSSKGMEQNTGHCSRRIQCKNASETPLMLTLYGFQWSKCVWETYHTVNGIQRDGTKHRTLLTSNPMQKRVRDSIGDYTSWVRDVSYRISHPKGRNKTQDTAHVESYATNASETPLMLTLYGFQWSKRVWETYHTVKGIQRDGTKHRTLHTSNPMQKRIRDSIGAYTLWV
jgi:hypothetical protein